MKRKGLIQLTLLNSCSSPKELKGGRNLEVRTDVEAMEGAAYWFASPGLLSLLSYRTQDHQPRDDSTHNCLGPPPPNYEIALIFSLSKCLTAGSYGSIF